MLNRPIPFPFSSRVLQLSLLLSVLFFLLYFGKILRDNEKSSLRVNTDSPLSIKYGCITESQGFKKALALQQLGIRRSYTANGSIDFEATWDGIPIYFNKVWNDVKEKLQLLSFLSDGEEMKYFVQFSDPGAECRMITLGVGQRVTAEQFLSERYPQCQFIGIDPVAKGNKKMYEGVKGAQFVQGAVRKKSGTHTQMYIQEDFSGKMMTFHHISIDQFLKKYNGDHLIDLLMMDVEGVEYEILDSLNEKYNEFPTICQINIEVHFSHINESTVSKGYQHFFENMEKMLQRYALFNTDFFVKYSMLRLFLFNFSNEECVRKFLCS